MQFFPISLLNISKEDSTIIMNQNIWTAELLKILLKITLTKVFTILGIKKCLLQSNKYIDVGCTKEAKEIR